MLRSRPRPNRTDTRFPYTTLFRAFRRLRANRIRRFGEQARQRADLKGHFDGIVDRRLARLTMPEGNGMIEGGDGDVHESRRVQDALDTVAVAEREGDRKSTRLNSSHSCATRMPSSA